MGTTAKALTLLSHFTRARPALGLSDLARLSGINKATCFRLMAELVDQGLAEQIPASRAYRIGPEVLRLARLREASVPLRAAVEPALARLAQASGETAHASHLVAGRLVTLAHAYGAPSGTQVMMEDADVLPFHATASGQAVMAFLSHDRVEAILSAPLPAATPATLCDPAALRDLLAAIRARGWAEAVETFERDVSALAVPLFDAEGAVMGAMAVAAPSGRMKDAGRSAILARLIDAARDVTKTLGGLAPSELTARARELLPERTLT